MKISQLFTGILLLTANFNSFAASPDLPIPGNLIRLDSATGIEQLTSSPKKFNHNYWSLSRYYVTENGLAYCAPASIVMVLNAMEIKPSIAPEHYPYKLFNQQNLFYDHQVLSKQITPTMINHQGLTLDQAYELSKVYVPDTKMVYGINISTLDQFKSKVTHTLQTGFVIVNYDRKTIKQVGGGHFSPIAAYNPKSDSFLILDVARYKYPPVWVKANELYKATQGIDSTSHNSRGLLFIPKQLKQKRDIKLMSQIPK
ncbi:phytochelatin synthase family protein [Parashewanella tropica]|uniref:phytochelatin synthase family protein n=1 Tax=Parashewanella tropica TaxID=2547970 RepID=UPI00105A1B16|nr:phytochelatin synthase family protein [Parashewanella tropica]